MECYACSNEASRQCKRCSRLYCEVHGGDLCAECLDPSSALPSFNLYRGSLLALLIGTAIAIWLLVRPPGAGDGLGVVLTDLTPTVIVTPFVDTATPPPDETPAGTPDDEEETLTPDAAETEEPEPTDTPGLRTYEVQSGDTLLGIAERFAPPGITPFDYAADIAEANDLGDVNTAIINPDDVLILP
ncbi:MAG: LysM peptidoglycan-binding domain-containing protein [Chloroflexi bacterium]|nr:LysM peptidoglycan-binding domain-containing protein [Chloroflexota bacterium]MCI0856016.1 LysM peptidoglycan-binding domain-containing protein [Chloroflexota bacterium]MCI0890928.1 LysM peptidoglycan-binding domain-containing protein [Chloroflexota bacterium]